MSSAQPPQPQNGEKYNLNRDLLASMRLNYQHYLWLDAFGYNLHPRIAADIKDRENLVVADIATGTGIWLHDMARVLPSTTKLEGLDIDLEQCPPPDWAPPNVSYRQSDALAPVPQDMLSRYDVIHLRHFVTVVRGNDPMTLINNLISMLKPGGWIQWSEWDIGTRNLCKARPETPSECMERVDEEIGNIKSASNLASWSPQLASLLSQAGLQETALEKHDQPLSHLPYVQTNFMIAAGEMFDGFGKAGFYDAGRAAEVKENHAAAAQECKAGVGFRMAKFMAVGQKPRQ